MMCEAHSHLEKMNHLLAVSTLEELRQLIGDDTEMVRILTDAIDRKCNSDTETRLRTENGFLKIRVDECEKKIRSLQKELTYAKQHFSPGPWTGGVVSI